MESCSEKLETQNSKLETVDGVSLKNRDWIERSHRFAVRVIKMAAHLPNNAPGRSIAAQIVRSAPSIVVNLEEAKATLTQKDTLHKTGIARREARETRRCLLIIRDAELLSVPKLEGLLAESGELVAMLTAGTIKLQKRIKSASG